MKGEHNFALHPLHALLATTTHDKLIDHVLTYANTPYIIEFLNDIKMTCTDENRIWSDPTKTLNYYAALTLAKRMNAMNRELEKVSIKESMAFMKKFRNAKNTN